MGVRFRNANLSQAASQSVEVLSEPIRPTIEYRQYLIHTIGKQKTAIERRDASIRECLILAIEITNR
jgi:hypothetical protein